MNENLLHYVVIYKVLHKKENICIFALKINHKINNCVKNGQNNN